MRNLHVSRMSAQSVGPNCQKYAHDLSLSLGSSPLRPKVHDNDLRAPASFEESKASKWSGKHTCASYTCVDKRLGTSLDE